MQPVPDFQLDPPEGKPLYCYTCGERIIEGYGIRYVGGAAKLWMCDQCLKEDNR